jgi:hypothetical protein
VIIELRETPLRHQLPSITDRIQGLLARIERRDYPDQAWLENTLTDGYACALSLDAECDRLERRIAERAARIGTDSSAEQARELSALVRLLARRRQELEALRDLLGVLRAGAQQARVA